MKKTDASAAYYEVLESEAEVVRMVFDLYALKHLSINAIALVGGETFALAQEQLTKNRHHSPRRTIEPTLLQGMLVCQQCGYALYRTSTRTSKRKLYYYRCLGSDAYRRLKGALCTSRPVRQDHLDQVVWHQIIRFLEDDTLMQSEIDRRKEAARNSDSRRQRQEVHRREQMRLAKNIERLIMAYQEGLLSLSQLRERKPSQNGPACLSSRVAS